MERQLKQRLVGASVLVLLAVVFLPMLLDRGAGPRRPAPPAELPAWPDAPAGLMEAPPPPPPAPRAEMAGQGVVAGWAVQVGSFASSDNAEELAARLREAGYAAFIVQAGTAAAPAHKVRIGPMALRSEAEALSGRLGREQALETILVRHP